MRSLLLMPSLFWLLFASAALAAESAVIEGAKKEGALVFYTTMDIQNSKPLLDAFMKLFEGFRRRVVPPDAYKNLRELTKLHNDALGIR